MTSPEQSLKFISDDELFSLVQGYIDNWNFHDNDADTTAYFSFNLSHWLLETYGQQDNKGRWSMSSDIDGFDGEELPTDLQHLVTNIWKNELLLMGGNTLNVISQSVVYEHDPVIPKWEEVEQLPTFDEQLKRMRTDPEIRENIQPTRLEVLPEVSLALNTRWSGWGLEFVTNKFGARVAVYGERGKTWTGLEFVQTHKDDQALLTELACRLALLGAKFVYYRFDRRSSYSHRQPKSQIDVLFKRLNGEEKVPIKLGDYQTKSGNAVKNLLISQLEEVD